MTLLLLSTLACRNKDHVYDSSGLTTDSERALPLDEDGDGFTADEDCDDLDPAVFPEAVELCNGLDDDCDGDVDEGSAADASTWYTDADGDGYGDSDSSVLACEQPSGTSALDGDCDDGDSAYHPSADESDCTDPNDYNCDGSVGYADADGDGFAACEDCDDDEPLSNPDGEELCDGLDNDCDGSTDEDDASDASTWYADTDSDSYGAPDSSRSACEQPTGYVADATDCDDSDADVNPSETEVCNEIDDDCDGDIDEDDAADTSTWYADADSDGYGDSATTAQTCEAPSGYVADDTDCDDSDADVNPGETEVCNEVDDDCDGTTDEDDAADASTWYADDDGDGYGDASDAEVSCSQPRDHVSDATDCDDTDEDINPGETELCNDVDDDCNGTVDDDYATDAVDWYEDADCDGFGDSSTLTTACTSPGDSWGTDDTDCDDTDPLVFPSAQELCSSTDNDCDGSVDNDCADSFEIASPSHSPVDSPASPAACASIGELSTSMNAHDSSNLSSFMAILDGTSTGLASSTDQDVYELDWSNRCGSDYSASEGNYSSTTNSWPTLSSTDSYGAGRFRGYLNIPCGEPLTRTLGLIGNDALSLSIEGDEVLTVNWNDGQWKKFRYVTFPKPGLYAFEVQWSTNLNCAIDPFELVWAEEFVTDYDEYYDMCAYSSCEYGDGEAIPDFEIVTDDWLVQSSDGSATSCTQCASSSDCSTGESCNSAGICE